MRTNLTAILTTTAAHRSAIVTNVMLALVMTAVAPAAANAGLNLTLAPSSPSEVSLTYSGFVTTAGLTLDATASNPASLVSPNQGRIRRAGALDVYRTNSTSVHQTFGTSGPIFATSSSGSAIRVNFTDPGFLGLPSGYVSDAAIFGSMNFAGTIASLGLSTGTYSFDWGIGGAGRTVTLNVTSAVPEIDPATGSSVLSLVAGVLALIEQRRRRATLVA